MLSVCQKFDKTNEKTDHEAKKLRAENKDLQNRFENKCLELKQSKEVIEDLKKTKNALSVALKGSKKEISENYKEFEKKKNVYEKKILDLSEFKNRKVAEEREENIKRRKELKKDNQKARKENAKNCDREPMIETMSDQTDNNNVDDSVETKAKEAGEILCKKDEVEAEQIDANEDLKSHTGEVIDENDEGFIGPKLPRMMTKAEVEAFKAELFAKYKF